MLSIVVAASSRQTRGERIHFDTRNPDSIFQFVRLPRKSSMNPKNRGEISYRQI